MADSQEIYIRNPLAVLNVDLCGMQAPMLLRAVLPWISLMIVHCLPAPARGRWMALCQRSLSCWPTVLLSHYATYSDTVKAATTHFELALDVVKLSTISVQTTYLHWNVHYNCSCYLVYQLVVSCYMAQLFWWSILIIGFIRRLMKSTFPYFIFWNVNIIWFLYSSVTTNWTLLHWVVDTEWHL